jgi:hypothetical protein
LVAGVSRETKWLQFVPEYGFTIRPYLVTVRIRACAAGAGVAV